MKKSEQIMHGLKILSAYTVDEFDVESTADSLYVGPMDEGTVSEKDQTSLKDLNWFYSPELFAYAIFF